MASARSSRLAAWRELPIPTVGGTRNPRGPLTIALLSVVLSGERHRGGIDKRAVGGDRLKERLCPNSTVPSHFFFYDTPDRASRRIPHAAEARSGMAFIDNDVDPRRCTRRTAPACRRENVSGDDISYRHDRDIVLLRYLIDRDGDADVVPTSPSPATVPVHCRSRRRADLLSRRSSSGSGDEAAIDTSSLRESGVSLTRR